MSAKYPYTFKRAFPQTHRVGGARKTRSELVPPARTTFLQLKGQEQVALCPQTNFYSQPHARVNSWVLNLAAPHAPLQAAAEAAALQVPLEAGEGGKGPQPPGVQGTGRATCAQDRALPGRHRRRTTPHAGPAELRGAAPVSPAGTPRRGLRGGRKGVTPGFQQRKGGNGRGGMWTPGPRRGAGSHLQAPNPPSRSCPNPPQVPDPSRSSHRLGFCVLGSGALTPHYPAEEIHLVAQPPALPAPSGKKR